MNFIIIIFGLKIFFFEKAKRMIRFQKNNALKIKQKWKNIFVTNSSEDSSEEGKNSTK